MLTDEQLAEINKQLDQRAALRQGGAAMLRPPEIEPRYSRDYARFLRSQIQVNNDGAIIKGLKAFSNGTIGFAAGGALGAMQALRDWGIREELKRNPDYVIPESGYRLNELRNNVFFDVQGDSKAGQFMLDLIQGGGQLATTMVLTGLTGGAGAAAFTGAQIFGNQYAELAEQGADFDRAIDASLVNTGLQTALEVIPAGRMAGRILGKIPVGKTTKYQAAKNIFKSVMEEGLTEAAQEFPEQFTNIYALNADLKNKGVFEQWKENAWENVKSAAYSGLLGGLLGGGVTGAGILLQKGQEVARRKLNITKIDDLGKTIHAINEQANLPKEIIRNTVNVRAGEDAILVDAAALVEYAQKEGKRLEDVAEELNISEEAINEAANAGQEIEIGIGDFATASSNKGKLSGIYEAMKDYMSFKDEGSVNEDLYKRQGEDRKINYEEDTPAGKLQAQLSEIYKSAVDAKIGKDQWGVIETVLSARAVAYNADNPAEFFERHPIRFIRTVRTPNRRYYQMSGDKQLGGISFDQEGRAIINLYMGRNATTAMHEIGHYFFESLFRDIEGGIASDMQRSDFDTLLAYTGIDYDSYKAADFEGRRKTHENIAEAWESYLMEGKAPSSKLAKVFAKMKKWFLTVYSKLSRTPYALAMTDNVRQVFDRMLASEAEIEAKIRMDGHFEKMPKELLDGLSDSSKAMLFQYAEKARDIAARTLTNSYLVNFGKNRERDIKEFENLVHPEVEQKLRDSTFYGGQEFLVDEIGKQTGLKSAKGIANRYLNNKFGEWHEWQAEMDATNEELRIYDDALEAAASAVGHVEWVTNDYYSGTWESDLTVGENLTKIREETGSNVWRINKRKETSMKWYKADDDDSKWLKIQGKQKEKKKQAKDKELKYMDTDKYYVTVATPSDWNEPWVNEWVESLGGRNPTYQDARELAEAIACDHFEFVPDELAMEFGYSGIDPGDYTLGIDEWFDHNPKYLEEFNKENPEFADVRLIREYDDNYMRKLPDSLTEEERERLIDYDLARHDFYRTKENYDAKSKRLEDALEYREYLLAERKKRGYKEYAKAKRNGLTAKQVAYFDWVAETVGYANGGEYAQAIIDNPTFEQAVRQEVKRRVKEAYPGIEQERKMAEESVYEAAYNDGGAELLALEYDLILQKAQKEADKQRTRTEQAQIAKEFKAETETEAKQFLAKQSLKDIINYRKYIRAEKNARLKYKEAVKNGDMEQAAHWKYQQAYNYAIIQEAQRICEAIKKGRDDLRKIRNLAKDAWGKSPSAYKHYNQVMALYERMGNGKSTWDKASKDQTLNEYFEEMKQRLGENNVVIPEWLLDESKMLNDPGNMTFEQYEDIANTIRHIYTLARKDHKGNSDLIAESAETEKAEILKHLEELPLKNDNKLGQANKPAPILKRILKNLQSPDNLFLELDNWIEGGYFARKWFGNLKHANDKVARAQNDIRKAREQSLNEYMANRGSGDDPTKEIVYKELGMDNNNKPVSVNKFVLIQMLINMGNDGNFKRLCETLPVGISESPLWVKPDGTISEGQALAMTAANLKAFLSKYLDARDIKYAQAQIDIASKYWEEIRDLEIRTKGFPPRQVVATPILFELANGETVYFKGGYYPLVRDIRDGSRPKGVNVIPDIEESGTRPDRFITNQSHVKERMSGAKYPVNLAEGAGNEALLEAVRDLYLRETMMDFDRIFMDADIRQAMIQRFGPENYKLLRDLLLDTANPNRAGTNGYADRTMEAVTGWLRRKAINAAIMLNLKPVVQNITNALLFGNSVEGFTHMDTFIALWDACRTLVTGGYEARKREINFCLETSEFMREKAWYPDISVREVLNDNKINKIERGIVKSGTTLLMVSDFVTAEPVWNRAFAKKIEAGASIQEAKDFADTVIRRAIGGSRTSEVAAIQRARGAWRLFTMFQNFFITQFNQWQREYHMDARLFKEGRYAEAATNAARFLTVKWLIMAAANVITSGIMPWDDDEDFMEEVAKESISYPLSLAGPYGQFASQLALRSLGYKPYRYRISAIESVLSKMENAASAPYRYHNGNITAQEMIETMTQPVEIMVGLPYATHNWFYNLYDYIANGMEPTAMDVYKRRPKRERGYNE